MSPINGLRFGNNDLLEKYKQMQTGSVRQPQNENPYRQIEPTESTKAAVGSANNENIVWNIVSEGVDNSRKFNVDNSKFGENTTATNPNNVKGIDGSQNVEFNPFRGNATNPAISSLENPFGITREFTDSLSRFDYKQPFVGRKHDWNA